MFQELKSKHSLIKMLDDAVGRCAVKLGHVNHPCILRFNHLLDRNLSLLSGKSEVHLTLLTELELTNFFITVFEFENDNNGFIRELIQNLMNQIEPGLLKGVRLLHDGEALYPITLFNLMRFKKKAQLLAPAFIQFYHAKLDLFSKETSLIEHFCLFDFDAHPETISNLDKIAQLTSLVFTSSTSKKSKLIDLILHFPKLANLLDHLATFNQAEKIFYETKLIYALYNFVDRSMHFIELYTQYCRDETLWNVESLFQRLQTYPISNKTLLRLFVYLLPRFGSATYNQQRKINPPQFIADICQVLDTLHSKNLLSNKICDQIITFGNSSQMQELSDIKVLNNLLGTITLLESRGKLTETIKAVIRACPDFVCHRSEKIRGYIEYSPWHIAVLVGRSLTNINEDIEDIYAHSPIFHQDLAATIEEIIEDKQEEKLSFDKPATLPALALKDALHDLRYYLNKSNAPEICSILEHPDRAMIIEVIKILTKTSRTDFFASLARALIDVSSKELYLFKDALDLISWYKFSAIRSMIKEFGSVFIIELCKELNTSFIMSPLKVGKSLSIIHSRLWLRCGENIENITREIPIDVCAIIRGYSRISTEGRNSAAPLEQTNDIPHRNKRESETEDKAHHSHNESKSVPFEREQQQSLSNLVYNSTLSSHHSAPLYPTINLFLYGLFDLRLRLIPHEMTARVRSMIENARDTIESSCQSDDFTVSSVAKAVQKSVVVISQTDFTELTALFKVDKEDITWQAKLLMRLMYMTHEYDLESVLKFPTHLNVGNISWEFNINKLKINWKEIRASVEHPDPEFYFLTRRIVKNYHPADICYFDSTQVNSAASASLLSHSSCGTTTSSSSISESISCATSSSITALDAASASCSISAAAPAWHGSTNQSTLFRSPAISSISTLKLKEKFLELFKESYMKNFNSILLFKECRKSEMFLLVNQNQLTFEDLLRYISAKPNGCRSLEALKQLVNSLSPRQQIQFNPILKPIQDTIHKMERIIDLRYVI